MVRRSGQQGAPARSAAASRHLDVERRADVRPERSICADATSVRRSALHSRLGAQPGARPGRRTARARSAQPQISPSGHPARRRGRRGGRPRARGDACRKSARAARARAAAARRPDRSRAAVGDVHRRRTSRDPRWSGPKLAVELDPQAYTAAPAARSSRARRRRRRRARARRDAPDERRARCPGRSTARRPARCSRAVAAGPSADPVVDRPELALGAELPGAMSRSSAVALDRVVDDEREPQLVPSLGGRVGAASAGGRSRRGAAGRTRRRRAATRASAARPRSRPRASALADRRVVGHQLALAALAGEVHDDDPARLDARSRRRRRTPRGRRRRRRGRPAALAAPPAAGVAERLRRGGRGGRPRRHAARARRAPDADRVAVRLVGQLARDLVDEARAHAEGLARRTRCAGARR